MFRKINNLIGYLRDSFAETKNITWPTKEETIKQFIVVLILSTIIVLLLYVIDIGLSALFTKITPH